MYSSLLVLLSNPNVVPCHIWIDLKFLLLCNGISRLAIFDLTFHMLTNLKPSMMNISDRMRECNEVSHEYQGAKPTDGVHMSAVEEREKELQSSSAI